MTKKNFCGHLCELFFPICWINNIFFFSRQPFLSLCIFISIQNIGRSIPLRSLLLLSFFPPWDTIYGYLSAWKFMICFSKYLQRDTYKSTQWYIYKKINDKNLIGQLNCSYFTLFLVTNLELSKMLQFKKEFP